MKLTIHEPDRIHSINLCPAFFTNENKTLRNGKKVVITPTEKAETLALDVTKHLTGFILEKDGDIIKNSFEDKTRPLQHRSHRDSSGGEFSRKGERHQSNHVKSHLPFGKKVSFR